MALAIAVVFGVVIGSFLNVVIRRLPEGSSIIRPRSHCPNCKRLIHWYDNVPILSYFLLGGRCRHCNRKISVRYPLVEALSGIVGLLMYDKFGLGIEWVIFFSFSAALIVLAFIDLDHRILPDPITLNGIWAGILASVYLAQPSSLAVRLLRTIGLESTNSRVIALTQVCSASLLAGGCCGE